MRHNDPAALEDLATAAGFRVEDRGDLPLLHYVRAVRPEGAGQAGLLARDAGLVARQAPLSPGDC